MQPARTIRRQSPGPEELGELSRRLASHEVHLKERLLGVHENERPRVVGIVTEMDIFRPIAEAWLQEQEVEASA